MRSDAQDLDSALYRRFLEADETEQGGDTVYCCDPKNNPDCPRTHCAYTGTGACFSTVHVGRAQIGSFGPCKNYNIRPWRDDSPPPDTEPDDGVRTVRYIDEDGLPTTVRTYQPEEDTDTPEEADGWKPWEPQDMREP